MLCILEFFEATLKSEPEPHPIGNYETEDKMHQFSTIPQVTEVQIGDTSLNKNVNPLSLGSTLDEKSNELLNESKRYAQELSMKIDKTEDLLILAKERKHNENLQSLDQSLQVLESFKKFNIDEVNFSSLGLKKPLKNNIDIKIEDEV